jgi:predicted phosphate transport protein (TIGR00153 family)
MADDESNTFTPWLIRRSEREFFEKIHDYAKDISDEIDLLADEVACVVGSDYNKCILSYEYLNSKSKEAFKARKALVRLLEESTVTPDHRGYLAGLIYSISDIAGYIDSASARLSLKHVEPSQTVKDGISEMMGKTRIMMDLFMESLHLLNEDLEKAIEKTEQINNHEEEIDIIRRGLLKVVVNNEEIKSAADLHVIIEILGSLETVSDKIDIAANKVEVIAMTHLP